MKKEIRKEIRKETKRDRVMSVLTHSGLILLIVIAGGIVSKIISPNISNSYITWIVILGAILFVGYMEVKYRGLRY